MSAVEIRFRRADWEFTSPFRIAYRQQTHAETVLVEIDDGNCVGRGEASGVSYHGETVASMLDQLAAVAADVRNGANRSDLYGLLTAGGARNAVDCALWDLESKRQGRRAWELAGINSMKPLVTAYTLGLDDLCATGQMAASLKKYSLLKLKLDGTDDIERVAVVRRARPDVEIVVDANQAWTESHLPSLVPALAELRVRLIEQPLALGRDNALKGFKSPLPMCADESCQTSGSLPELVGKYEYINIKLDKTGGLTEALRVAHVGRALGFKLMVGCMGGSSLSIAPAMVVGQYCDVVDLDGPLLIKSDIQHPIIYEGSRMLWPDSALWG